MTTPIVDFVRQYAQSGTARLHMPGHKGQSLLGCEPWDITEIRGADELYEPRHHRPEPRPTPPGCSARSTPITAPRVLPVHPGHALSCYAGCAPHRQAPVLLAARNAHKALLYAAALLDFDIRWLWPAPEDTGALCSCPVTVQALSTALEELGRQGRAPFGVYLTSRITWAGCRISRPSLPSAMPTVCPCWWITPTGPTCAFCPAGAPSHRPGRGGLL